MRYYIVTAEKDGFDIGEFFTPTAAVALSGSWCRVAEIADIVDHLRRLTYIDSQDDLDIIEELCDLAGVEWAQEMTMAPGNWLRKRLIILVSAFMVKEDKTYD